MPPTALYVPIPSIKIAGAELAAAVIARLLDVRVDRSVTVPGTFSLRLHDDDFELIDGSTFSIGAEIEISFTDPNGSRVRVLSGEITAIASEQDGEGLHELVVSGYDRAHRLGRSTNIRAYQKQTYAEIVRRVAGKAGLRANVDATALDTNPLEYVSQTTTDYAFLNEIARRTGCEWFVDAKELVMRARPTATAVLTLKFREDLRRFKVRFSAVDVAKNVTVRGWDPRSGHAIVSQQSTNAYPAKGPLLADDGRRKAAELGENTYVATGRVVQSHAEGDQLAQAYVNRMAGSELMARGEALARPDIDAGSTIKIDRVGTKLSGEYYITSVEHVYSVDHGLLTRFTAGGFESSSLVDLLGRGDAVPAWTTLGVTVGIVTNNQDPDKLGRVRMKFPSISDDVESEWARVLAPGGGKAKGAHFVPGVNDEVLVAFEHGDVRRPYVIGALWNERDKPPASEYVKDGKPTLWSIMTPFGHKLSFDNGDDADVTGALLALKDGKTKLFLNDKKVQLIAGDESTVEVKNGQASIVLAANGDITIKGANVTIEATANVQIKGAQGTVKTSGTLSLESSGSTAIKGASTKVEASGILELSGALMKIN